MSSKLDPTIELLTKTIDDFYTKGYPSPTDIDSRGGSTHPSIVRVVQNELGISARTYYRRLKKAASSGYIVPWDRQGDHSFTPPETPDMDVDCDILRTYYHFYKLYKYMIKYMYNSYYHNLKNNL